MYCIARNGQHLYTAVAINIMNSHLPQPRNPHRPAQKEIQFNHLFSLPFTQDVNRFIDSGDKTCRTAEIT